MTKIKMVDLVPGEDGSLLDISAAESEVNSDA